MMNDRAGETTVIIRTIGRPTLQNAIDSAEREGYRMLVIVDGTGKPSVRLPDGSGMVVLGRKWGFYGGMAANVGAALARTPFITFLDDDDEFIPGTGARFRADLATLSEIDVVITGIMFKNPIRFDLFDRQGRIIRSTSQTTLCTESKIGLVAANVMMATFKAKLFAKLPFVDDAGAEEGALSDFLQIRKWVQAGASIRWTEYPIYFARPKYSDENGRGL